VLIGIRQAQLTQLNIDFIAEITERDIARKALRESQERFQRLSDLSFEGILIHKDGVAVDVNESLLRMFGYNRDEVIGENIISMVVPPEYHSKIKENMVKGTAESYELLCKKKDGTLFPTEIEARNIGLEDDTLRVTAVRDISARKMTQQKLAILTAAAEQSPSSIVITNTDGIIDYVNPKFVELTGYSYDEVVGKNPNVLKSGEQEQSFYKQLWNTIYDGDGVALKTIGTIHDVTESTLTGQALTKSESHINAIINSLHETFIITYDINRTHIAAWGSDALEKRYGIRTKDLVGMSLNDIFPPDMAALKIEQIKKIFSTGIAETEEFRAEYPPMANFGMMSPYPPYLIVLERFHLLLVLFGILLNVNRQKNCYRQVKQDISEVFAGSTFSGKKT